MVPGLVALSRLLPRCRDRTSHPSSLPAPRAPRASFALPPGRDWFGIVQLAAWDCCPGDAVAVTRDIQLNVSLSVRNVGFGTAADLGDINSTSGSIHPRLKQPLGARLASSRFHAAGADPLVNPRAAAVTAADAPDGTLAVMVAFDPATLGPLALNVSATLCPPGVPAYNCADGGFRILADNGSWLPAAAELGADAASLKLTARATARARPLAASLGWSAWPLLSVARTDTGAVVLPFLRYV